MPPRYKLDPENWSIRDWKNIAWETVDSDRLLCPTPAFVFSVSIHSNGTAEADAKLFDATSLHATGKYIQLYCVDEDARQLTYWPPLYFHQGIYIDIGTNVEMVVVQYLPWRD